MQHFGLLLPLWVLGAPLVLALFELMQTPSSRRDERRPLPTAGTPLPPRSGP